MSRLDQISQGVVQSNFEYPQNISQPLQVPVPVFDYLHDEKEVIPQVAICAVSLILLLCTSEKSLSLSPLRPDTMGCHSTCGKDSQGIGLRISRDGVRCHLSGTMGHGFGRQSPTDVCSVCVPSWAILVALVKGHYYI